MTTDFTTGPETAAALDASDPLATFRGEFRIPPTADGTPQIYLVGNSLGAAPSRANDYVMEETSHPDKCQAASV